MLRRVTPGSAWSGLACLVWLAALGGTAWSAEAKVELLWPGGAPGALGDKPADKPTLILYVPERASVPRTAIVVIPGGGYGGLAIDHEGHQFARWFNEQGVAAFILDYRHRGKGYAHPAPLQDAQRAIRTVRARAEEFGIDPGRIGVIGFSAGGHLASTVATHFDAGDPAAADPVARAGCRPDYAILCYGVLTLGEPFTHHGSQENLLGKDADESLVRSLSNEKQVTRETPPAFLWHTTEDPVVPVENSVAFSMACRKAGVPVELHVFEKGQHGLGLAQGRPGAEHWPELLKAWMTLHGLLK